MSIQDIRTISEGYNVKNNSIEIVCNSDDAPLIADTKDRS